MSSSEPCRLRDNAIGCFSDFDGSNLTAGEVCFLELYSRIARRSHQLPVRT